MSVLIRSILAVLLLVEKTASLSSLLLLLLLAVAGVAVQEESAIKMSDTSMSNNINNNNNNQTCPQPNQQQREHDEDDEQCSIYIAPSTLNGAGIGMYAGKSFKSQEIIDFLPDHTIPIIYLSMQHNNNNNNQQQQHLEQSNNKIIQYQHFLWEDYYWNAFYLKCGEHSTCGDLLGRHDDIYFASCGFGATANSYQDFVNVHIDYEVFPYHHYFDFDGRSSSSSKTDGISDQPPTPPRHHHHHRSKDPGSGAFSQYQFRLSKVTQSIQAGDELFVNYGENWFHKRKNSLGPIPIRGDHQHAENLYRSFQILKQKLLLGVSSSSSSSSSSRNQLHIVLDDAWNTFVINSHWKSRQFTALQVEKIQQSPELSSSSSCSAVVLDDDGSTTTRTNSSSSIVDEIYNEMEQVGGLINLKKREMRRSINWLQENGVCADNLVPRESTIKQAGNGAFAKRFLKGGSIVLPIPLIHIPDRSLLDMYQLQCDDDNDDFSGGGQQQEQQQAEPKVINNDVVIGKQLLLNYCFGHEESTMLLSPYGPMINWVNHNQTLANVRLQWASPKRSNHNPQWLEKEIWYFENEAEKQEEGMDGVKVAMDLIALRDINPGEEIFLDYGSEWEAAWQNHAQTWEPVQGADQYESAEDLNRKNDRLKTMRQLSLDPYPNNVVLKFNVAFADPKGWKTALYAGQSMDDFINQGHYVPCEVIKYMKSYGGFGFYSVVVYDENDGGQRKLIKEAPREAFLFHEVPYTADIFLPNAFRHEIGIPDDIFPKKWKNRLSSAT